MENIKTYQVGFTKTVTGYVEVKAKNKKEALEKAEDCGEWEDEFDYKSDYKFDDPIEA
jgi:hypothetical protein